MAKCVNCGQQLGVFTEVPPLWPGTEEKLCPNCRNWIFRFLGIPVTGSERLTAEQARRCTASPNFCGLTRPGIDHLNAYALYLEGGDPNAARSGSAAEATAAAVGAQRTAASPSPAPAPAAQASAQRPAASYVSARSAAAPRFNAQGAAPNASAASADASTRVRLEGVPETLTECMQPDKVTTSLGNWANRLESWGRILLIVLLVIGVICTISDCITIADVDEDLVFGTLLSSAFDWTMYAFLEYWGFKVLALLIRALATITGNTTITARIALMNAVAEGRLPLRANPSETQLPYICGNCGTRHNSPSCPNCGNTWKYHI